MRDMNLLNYNNLDTHSTLDFAILQEVCGLKNAFMRMNSIIHPSIIII